MPEKNRPRRASPSVGENTRDPASPAKKPLGAAPSRAGENRRDPASIVQRAGQRVGAERDSVDKLRARSEARARLTSRAAILAVVACAIALSLAYPLREYIAQRREIAQLRVQQRQEQEQVDELTRQKQRLGDESYIRREARRR